MSVRPSEMSDSPAKCQSGPLDCQSGPLKCQDCVRAVSFTFSPGTPKIFSYETEQWIRGAPQDPTVGVHEMRKTSRRRRQREGPHPDREVPVHGGGKRDHDRAGRMPQVLPAQ